VPQGPLISAHMSEDERQALRAGRNYFRQRALQHHWAGIGGSRGRSHMCIWNLRRITRVTVELGKEALPTLSR
jgi:hypothetical protein